MIERFMKDPTTTLAVQLGRPLEAWFETYCRRQGGDRPDRFLMMEVKGFIDVVRAHAAEVLGPGISTDAAAVLLSCAGMVAKNMRDIDHALTQIADWHRFYLPKPMRAGIVAERRERQRDLDAMRATPMGRIRARLDRHAFEMHPMMMDGTRTFPFGGTTMVLRIGDAGDMQLGILWRRMIYIISQIDDRDDGGRRESAPAPEPTPELAY